MTIQYFLFPKLLNIGPYLLHIFETYIESTISCFLQDFRVIICTAQECLKILFLFLYTCSMRLGFRELPSRQKWGINIKDFFQHWIMNIRCLISDFYQYFSLQRCVQHGFVWAEHSWGHKTYFRLLGQSPGAYQLAGV